MDEDEKIALMQALYSSFILTLIDVGIVETPEDIKQLSAIVIANATRDIVMLDKK